MQISATWRIAVETLKNVDDSIKNYLVLPLNLLNEQFVKLLKPLPSMLSAPITDNMSARSVGVRGR